MRQERELTAVYVVTGFLESGKTSLIRTMLEDKDFSRGMKTLIISCEEGEEELEESLLAEGNATVVSIDEKEQLTARHLIELDAQYRPERVILEYNSVWGIEYLGNTGMPALWRVVQVITTVDATTFDNYFNNMRVLLTDPMKEADLVIFNRCTEEMPKSQWRRTVRAMNPNTSILFENTDGTSEDGIADEDLPYDMKADIIDIADDQLGIFYIDSLDHAGRYEGKTIRLTGQAFQEKSLPKGYFYFGRYAMTCCANDIAQIGWVTQGTIKPNSRQFYRLTAKCSKVRSQDQDVVMFTEVNVESAAKPKEKYVTFS